MIFRIDHVMVKNACELVSTLYYGVPITMLQFVQLILDEYWAGDDSTDATKCLELARRQLILTGKLTEPVHYENVSLAEILQNHIDVDMQHTESFDANLRVIEVPHDHSTALGQYCLACPVQKLPGILKQFNVDAVRGIYEEILGRGIRMQFMVINNDCACCN